MSTRKTFPTRPRDVPAPVVAALLALLLALFVPIVALTPALPTTLPPLGFDERAVLAHHAAAPRRAPPAYLAEAFAALAEAAARRDGPATSAAQREFAALLVDAAGDAPAARAAVREAQLAAFLRAVDGGHGGSIVRIARRHRLAGAEAAPGVSRAMLVAWFDLRWEAMAARETLRGSTAGLADLVARLPTADERRALTAWALYSDCDALLGAAGQGALVPAEVRRCAEAREAFVGLAAQLEPAYPAEEARGTIAVLEALGLERLAAESTDDPTRPEVLRQHAREAYTRAYARFHALAQRDRSRRLRRYLLGTTAGMGL